MKRSVVAIAGFLAGLLACTTASADRGPGWEFGADIIYQLSQDIDFKGGSQASLDDDWGLTVNFGYRFSNKLELQFGLDWSDVDYDAELQTAINNVPAGVVSVRGTAESFTPRVSVHYNFTEGDIAPFVKAGIGWSFIDTNIPDGRPQNVCWWDPWWGYVCGTVQDTRSIDGFQYEIGVGLRWDIGPGYTLRASYEKHWIDLGEADGTPDLDQFKIGIAYRY